MAYLLDANVMIDAKRRYYPFDVCPAFWDWLDLANQQGEIFSVEAVRTELTGRGDNLSTWIDARPGLFIQPDADVPVSLGALGAWTVGCGRFTDAAVATFFSSADFHLIGEGHAHSHVVVTNEVAAPDATARVKIPDAAAAVGVACLTPFEMLRQEGVRFDLRR